MNYECLRPCYSCDYAIKKFDYATGCSAAMPDGTLPVIGRVITHNGTSFSRCGAYHEGFSPLQLEKKALERAEDNNKLRWELLPAEAIEEVIGVFTFGAVKYPDGGRMRDDANVLSIFGAILRHLFAWRRRSSIDHESRRRALAHAAANTLILLQHDLAGTGTDDRKGGQS